MNKDVLELGDAIMFRNIKPNLISRAIQVANHHCHVGCYSGNGNMIHYTIGGCKESLVDEYIKKNYLISVCRFDNITSIQQKDLVSYAQCEIGQFYDYSAYAGYIAIGIAAKFGLQLSHWINPWDNAGRVCSSGYAIWAKYAGLYVNPIGTHEAIMPDDIYLSLNMWQPYDDLERSK